MHYANNYRGRIPVELYTKLQNAFPQQDGETDAAWLLRVKRDPTLAQKMFGTQEFKTELTQAVSQRLMAQAGARRMGQRHAGPALVKVVNAARVVNTIAQRYRDEFMVGNERQYKHASEAYQQLMEQFDAATPANGSIFWNGVNELALAKLVDAWNTELGAQVFGQLEATTAARYVNKKFEWDEGGVFQKYFTQVSDRLGHAATGHVTSVVRCGLRHDSIFTVTELPRMLQSMEEQIRRREEPTVTDLSIVVIEPKHLPNRPVAVFTNNEITMIPIVRPRAWRINGRDDCTIDGHVTISPWISEYWTLRGPKRESAAGAKIMRDCRKLITWP